MTEVCSPLPTPPGTSVAEPCTGVAGVAWCGDVDYFRWRRVLQTERHALFDRLEALVKLIDDEGTAQWSVVTRAALKLCNEDSYDLLQHYPFAWLDAAQVIWKEGYIGPISQLAQMSARVHQATCEVGQALQAHGHAIPGEPTPPPPQLDWPDKVLKHAQSLASAATYLVVGGAVLVGGFAGISWWLSRPAAAASPPPLPPDFAVRPLDVQRAPVSEASVTSPATSLAPLRGQPAPAVNGQRRA